MRGRPRVVTMNGNLRGPGGSTHASAFTDADRREFGRKPRSRPSGAVPAARGKVDAILARFPGPVTLHVSRLKFLGLLAASLGFVAALLYMLDDGALSPSATLKAWLGIVVFGMCALVAAVMLLPGAGGLTLGADGFARITLFMTFRKPWRQVGSFTVVQYSLRRGRTIRFVGYDDDALAPDNRNRRMTGRNAALPDTYGLAHEDLASLMSQWRARALAQSR
jgi:hypothetical protein